MNNKTLGSILIVAGTAIGAGMLVTPIITAAAGFSYATLVMILLWAIMCISALLMAEATLAFPAGYNGFITIAHATLGRSGQIICWLAFLGLLYALAAAYIAGGGSILSTTLKSFFAIDLPEWMSSIIFLVVFGSFIYFGARSVDMVNRFLVSVKGIIFIITISLVTPYIDLQKLSAIYNSHILLAAIPILVTAFGFHVVIPSIVSYNQNQVKPIIQSIVIGSFIPLVIYLIWLAGVLGIIPLVGTEGFTGIVEQAVAARKDEVGLMLLAMNNIVHNPWVAGAMNFFSHLAITTSFLGIGLALFDFLLDVRKNRESTGTRIQTLLLTFLPPLVFALYYPQGFRMALGFAGIFVAVTCIMLPAIFVWRVRRDPELSSAYRVFGDTPLLIGVILFGVIVILLEIMDKLKWLPTLANTLIQ